MKTSVPDCVIMSEGKYYGRTGLTSQRKFATVYGRADAIMVVMLKDIRGATVIRVDSGDIEYETDWGYPLS